MLYMLVRVHFSENLSKIHCRHCSEEQQSLVEKFIGEEKHKEVQIMIGCSAKMMSNALKWQPKPERQGRKWKTANNLEEEPKWQTLNQTLNSSQRSSEDSEARWRKHHDMGMFFILWCQVYLSHTRNHGYI